VIIMVLGKRPA